MRQQVNSPIPSEKRTRKQPGETSEDPKGEASAYSDLVWQDQQPTLTHVVASEDIARRAYELYELRGGGPGSDLEDWLTAERELKSAPL